MSNITIRNKSFAIARVWVAIAIIVYLANSWGSYACITLAIILIGTLQYHLNILGHDGIHFLLHPNRRRNDFLTRWFLVCPQGMPLKLMRKNHMNHHLHLGHSHDEDRQYYSLERFGSRSAYRLWFLTVLFGGMALPIARKLTNRKPSQSKAISQDNPNSKSFMEVGICHFIIFVMIWLLTGKPWGYVLYWAVPLTTIMVGLNSIRSCLEHAVGATEPFETRLFSFQSNPIERFFLAPYNMNFHAEHHMKMIIPYHQLPEYRAQVERQGNIKVWRSYWERFRQLDKNFGRGLAW